ncbi:MAG TPA: oxidoreductase [Alphaproteobacteria bacterium]|nr:oxidoreductase [Alphaproteobacteria bacterium]HIB55474.1 oxidoreductase [Alphaproteobacteria bacterium]HIN91371.1 oxidoreductase [Alphaproteobacteria bacterium]
MSMKYPTLFSPITVGVQKLRNRIVHTATVTAYGANGKPTQRLIDYHHARAAGGTAMIVTELMPVHHTSIANPFLVNVFDEKNFELLKRWADTIEGEDCRLVGQIGHVGRQQLWNSLATPVSATSKPDPLSWTVAHELDHNEINELINSFVESSERLQRAGFSGIELHGAHGYLLTQFMSPFSNDRNDDYGGSREGRLKFVSQLINRIRKECGKEFLIGLKMPCDEGVTGGIDPNEAEKIIDYLVALGGVDYFAFSQGNSSASLETHLPDMHFPLGPFLKLHGRMRKRVGSIPVMTMGRIKTAEAAEKALTEGDGDLIGLSRVLLSDAAWVKKTLQGRENEIRPCISCNYCWGEVHVGRGIACVHNPELGTSGESDWRPERAIQKKRVAVVGAGVAGLEAAWISAARGHDVILFGASSKVGGKAFLEACLPGRGDIARAINFQKIRAEEAGVQFELGKRVSLREINEFGPQKVVFATGAQPVWPETLAKDSPACELRSLSKELLHQDQERKGTAILFDQDHTAAVYAASELLAQRYQRLIIVTPKTTIGSKVNYISLIGVMRRLSILRIDIIATTVPLALNNETLLLRNILNGDETEIEGVTCLTYATPRKVDDELMVSVRGAGFPAQFVGDCNAPRGMAAAIHEGHQAGITV